MGPEGTQAGGPGHRVCCSLPPSCGQSEWNPSVLIGLCGQLVTSLRNKCQSFTGAQVTLWTMGSFEVFVGDEWIVFLRLHTSDSVEASDHCFLQIPAYLRIPLLFYK